MVGQGGVAGRAGCPPRGVLRVGPHTGAEPPPVRPRADARAAPPATLGRPAGRTAPTTRLIGPQSPSRAADRAAARTGRPRHSTGRLSPGPPNRRSSVGRRHNARRRQPTAPCPRSYLPRSLSKASRRSHPTARPPSPARAKGRNSLRTTGLTKVSKVTKVIDRACRPQLSVTVGPLRRPCGQVVVNARQ